MKTKGFFKLTALILAVLMTAAVFAACGGNDKEKPGETDKPAETDEPVENGDNGNLLPGEDTDDGKDDTAIKGETKDYGIFTGLFIPESMDFTPGTMIDPESPEGFRLADKDHPMKYFYVGTSTDPESDIELGKEVNAEQDPRDVSFELNGNTWTGYTYKYNGETDVFQIFTRIDGHVVSIMSAGYSLDEGADSVLVKAILASIKLG